ncbi:MAG: undecaprenyldiphospho-muramoylpentapeptide beta-N-acetylglucosaminyltransferase [Gammaproteobacteria bacterium]
MKAMRPVLIMAGGTGGHVFPALAVAEKLREWNVPVAWLGTRQGLEARVIPPTGIPVHWMRVKGLRGKNIMRLFVAPFMLFWAMLQAFWIMIRVRPVAVLGMGGFVTGPGGAAAWVTRRPLLIHEQNSVAGLTNRLLAPLAKIVMVAFPGSFKQALHAGNPVRSAMLTTKESNVSYSHTPPRLLVVGGSLGAAVFNERLPAVLAKFSKAPVDVWHQTGLKNIDSATKAYSQAGVKARVDAFIDDMDAAYTWADLVLCRAGAMTVAELAVKGLPSILVPYPYAVDDHQTGNAGYLSAAGAAVLLQQSEMTDTALQEALQLLYDADALRVMAHKARQLALPDAATTVARQCLKQAGIATEMLT